MKEKNIDIIIISFLIIISLISNVHLLLDINSNNNEYDILICDDYSENNEYNIKVYWKENVVPFTKILLGEVYFGSQPVKIQIYKEQKLIKYIKTDIRNDLEGLENENCEVIWNEKYIKLILKGKDQKDEGYIFYLD